MRRRLVLLLAILLCGNLLTPASRGTAAPSVPVVLIHGQGGSPVLTWKTVIENLEARGYRRGVTLFALDLSQTHGDMEYLGIFGDTAFVADEIRHILALTGAKQVDLVGHSRGGLIVRFLTVDVTLPVIRRAVSLDTPHDGVLPGAAVQAIVDAAGLSTQQQAALVIPDDLQPDSIALRTLVMRERSSTRERVPALAIGTTWREGVPGVLSGNDGAVPLESQLDWPGAATRVFRLGPTPDQLRALMQSEMGRAFLAWKSPHLQSLESAEVVDAVVSFLAAPKVATPFRVCEPRCGDGITLVEASVPQIDGY